MFRIYGEHMQDSLASNIVHFADALTYQMMQAAKEKEKENCVQDILVNTTNIFNAPCISIDPTKEVESSLSCPSCHNQSHQKMYLKSNQLCCIWCSGVNFRDHKTWNVWSATKTFVVMTVVVFVGPFMLCKEGYQQHQNAVQLKRRRRRTKNKSHKRWECWREGFRASKSGGTHSNSPKT